MPRPQEALAALNAALYELDRVAEHVPKPLREHWKQMTDVVADLLATFEFYNLNHPT